MFNTSIKALFLFMTVACGAFEVSSSAIVQVKQIEIPHYPNAFNPSIVPYEDGYLLSFRYQTKFPKTMKLPRADVSMLGLVKLDANFELQEESIQLLHLASYSPNFSLTAEDGRLILVGDRLFLIFNDLFEKSVVGEAAMYLAELKEKGGEFVVKGKVKPLLYEKMRRIEKNWSPFVAGGKCYCIYSDQPERTILQLDVDTGLCREVVRTPSQISWELGQVRGGTPALEMEEGLLTFFHSSFQVNRKAVYVMGAYLFGSEFPFAVQKKGELPLGQIKDYEKMGVNKAIVFPGGLVVEEKLLHVAWGKNDREIWITSFDRNKLLESMKSL